MMSVVGIIHIIVPSANKIQEYRDQTCHALLNNWKNAMRDSSDITIQKAIVHLIELDESSDKKAKKLTLSDGDIPLGGSKELKDFFSSYVQKNLGDKSARTACFVRQGNDQSQIMPPAQKAIRNNSHFVESSRAIAARLHAVSHGNTSPGAVLFLKYKTGNKPNESFLAILLLDQTMGFQKSEEKDNGKTYIRLTKIDDLIPSANARLLKCAFICDRDDDLDEDESSYDMVLLDRQKPNEPANYFSVKFVGAKWFKDSKQLTRAFIFGANDGLDDIRDQIGRNKSETVRSAIEVAVKGNEVEVESWVNNLNINNDAKKVLVAKIQKKVPDASFQPDEEIANKLTKKRVFKGDYGFRMIVNSTDYRKIVKKRTDSNGREVLELSVPGFKEVIK